MSIAEARAKCKAFAAKVPRDVFLVAILLLASSASYGLGILTGRSLEAGPSTGSGQGGEGFSVEQPDLTAAAAAAAANSPTSPAPATGQVVASKNGTKYYLPSCSGASRISDANKVWFASASAAAAAGYQPAANCKGL